jgi:crotonobetainyl-CoA:carnitine CoA-transferase CaiB-like acyl-CoA transferase
MPDWRSFLYRIGNAADLYALMLEFTQKYTMIELFEAGKREGVPIAPILNIEDFYNSPHTKAREYFVEVEHPVAGRSKVIGSPIHLSETPPEIYAPAPLLGEHSSDILKNILNYSDDQIDALKRGKII